MPDFLVNDVIRVTSRWKFNGQDDQVNVWFFRCLTAGSCLTADLVLDVQTWLDQVFNPINAAVPAGSLVAYDLKIDLVHYDVGTAKIITDQNLYLGPWTVQNPPGGAGEALPLMTSAVVHCRTSRPKTRGRKFLPAFVESQSGNGGQLTSAAKTLVLAAAAAMLQQLAITPGTAVFLPGVISKYGTVAYFLNFLSAVVTDYLCTQRRRRVGVGG